MRGSRPLLGYSFSTWSFSLLRFKPSISIFLSPSLCLDLALCPSFIFGLFCSLPNGNTNAANGSPTLWSSRRRASAFKGSYNRPPRLSLARSSLCTNPENVPECARAGTRNPLRLINDGFHLVLRKKSLFPLSHFYRTSGRSCFQSRSTW